MTGAIEQYAPASGRVMREDSSIANVAAAMVPTTITSGQNASVTTTAAALGASLACAMVALSADDANGDVIYWGSATAQFSPLSAGQTVIIPISNVATIFVKAKSGTQKASYAALG